MEVRMPGNLILRDGLLVRKKRMVERRIAWLIWLLGWGIGRVLGKVFFAPLLGIWRADWDKGFTIGKNKAVLAPLIGSFDYQPGGGKAQDVGVM
jgi:hypothetical protein